jgi:hypothetical protein
MVRDYLQLDAGQQVLITTDTAADRQLIDALIAACLILDARPSVMTIPQLPMQGCLADPYVPGTIAGAVAGCEIWIDLTFPYLAGSAVQAKAMEEGRIRYVLCSDLNAGGLTRLFGGARFGRIAEIQQRLAAIFAAAVGSEIHITTPRGTNVRFTLAEPELMEPPRVTGPGMFMLPGACTMIPKLESVRGAVTVETIFHEYYAPLLEPVTFSVDGRVTGFSGGGIHGPLLDRVLRRAGGGQYGYIIHFTHGFHPATRFTGASFVEDMRSLGSDAVGLGLPFWAPGGGENHPDAVMTCQSIWIDGDQLVSDGRIVGGGTLAELAANLLPYYR